MYLQDEGSEVVAQLSQRIQQLVQTLLEGFELPTESVHLEQVENLYDHFDTNQLFLINDGMLHMCHNHTQLASYDEGDLIGLICAFDLPCPVICTDEFVELTPINRDDFLRHVYSDKRLVHYWSHMLMCQNALMMHFLARIAKEDIKPAAGFQNIEAGGLIIRQGDIAEHVYTIIDGCADVFVDDVKVGEINTDEVFGAMAAFTGEERSATVIAQTECSIMTVPVEDFVVLIEAQPVAAVNLIKGMARQIRSLNQKLVDK